MHSVTSLSLTSLMHLDSSDVVAGAANHFLFQYTDCHCCRNFFQTQESTCSPKFKPCWLGVCTRTRTFPRLATRGWFVSHASFVRSWDEDNRTTTETIKELRLDQLLQPKWPSFTHQKTVRRRADCTGQAHRPSTHTHSNLHGKRAWSIFTMVTSKGANVIGWAMAAGKFKISKRCRFLASLLRFPRWFSCQLSCCIVESFLTALISVNESVLWDFCVCARRRSCLPHARRRRKRTSTSLFAVGRWLILHACLVSRKTSDLIRCAFVFPREWWIEDQGIQQRRRQHHRLS